MSKFRSAEIFRAGANLSMTWQISASRSFENPATSKSAFSPNKARKKPRSTDPQFAEEPFDLGLRFFSLISNARESTRRYFACPTATKRMLRSVFSFISWSARSIARCFRLGQCTRHFSLITLPCASGHLVHSEHLSDLRNRDPFQNDMPPLPRPFVQTD